MCADDTVLFWFGKNVESITKILNDELDQVNTWLRENSLFMNRTAKTESMLFGTCARLSSATSFNIVLNGYAITHAFEFKYLGIMLDERLTWNTRIKYTIFRAGKRAAMLGRIRNNLTIYCAKVIYEFYIRPIAKYADTVWAFCGQGNINQLEKLQRRAVRIMGKADSSDKTMEDLKWDKLESRGDLHVLQLVLKVMKGRCPQFLQDYFTFNRDVVPRPTRQWQITYTRSADGICQTITFIIMAA